MPAPRRALRVIEEGRARVDVTAEYGPADVDEVVERR